jgi:two-component system cell cycle response regulator
MRILIAEDDPTSSLVLEKTIKKLGYECLSAQDGLQAWELVRANKVDTVISDWMMPGMDGIELCRRVRAHPAAPYIYFIFLTALDDKKHCLTGLEAGADDYLSKPLNSFDLKTRLLVAARVTLLHRQLAEQKSELERLNRLLFQQAHRDPLTQIRNRLQLKEDLDAMQSQVARYKHSFCAALCDIDFFKAYNDHYGHLAGDEVLRLVAQTIAQSVRDCDAVYRYGGEEFLVILPEQSLHLGTIAMQRVLRAVEDLAIPHEAREPAGVITISAGVAAISPGYEKTIEALLKEADQALYHAKGSGRNRVAVHFAEQSKS